MSLSLAVLAASSLGGILNAADLRGAIVGAVVAAPDGKALWAQNPDVRLMPASNQKLFTVAFALDTLGSNHQSETRFWRDEESIAIDSDGTLDLSYLDLGTFAKSVGSRPKVFLSQAFRPGRPESWQLGDTPNRYAPTITAFAVERGGVTLWKGPSGFGFRPAPLGLSVSERMPLSAGAVAIAKGLRFDPTSGVVFVPPDSRISEGVVDTLSQPAPDRSAAAFFGDEIVLNDVDPRLVRRRAPDATLRTDPLKDVAGRCLKPSDNFLAEQLLMMTARRKVAYPVAVDYTNAPAKLGAWGRDRVGLPDGAFDPADGSGLSRKNLVTARSVARLLNWSRKQSWGGVYGAAHAASGEGTMKGRLSGVRFRGKTGTLTGACSLSGLVRCKSGRELAVSLLVNHYACSTARVRAIQDEFVRRVAVAY